MYPEPARIAELLAGLHATLRELPAPVTGTPGPFTDVHTALGVFARDGVLGEPELDALRAEADRLEPVLRMPGQWLHGDAHPGNLLSTPDGPMWTDFEDSWYGPLEWDLACLLHTTRLDGARVLAHYPGAPEPDRLREFSAARSLHAVCWQLVLGQRFPAHAERARSALDARIAGITASRTRPG